MHVGAESEDSGWDPAERYLGRLVDVAASRSTLRTARDHIPRPCEDVPAMAEVDRELRANWIIWIAVMLRASAVAM